jgi:hypothetical protein
VVTIPNPAPAAKTVLGVAASQGSMVLPTSPTVFQMGSAGRVIVQYSKSNLVLLASISSANVVSIVETNSGKAVSVTFRKPGTSGVATFGATVVGSDLSFGTKVA